MSKVEFTAPIRPFGKARPRVTRRGTFMPKRYQERIGKLQFMAPPLDHLRPPLAVDVIAWRRIPKSGENRNRFSGEPCQTKPDADNIAGAVMDALFDDDSAIVDVRCRKRWGKDDKLHITISEVEVK